MTAAELKLYEHAKTVLDWSPKRIRELPILHKLHPAKSQAELPGILERTGQAAMAMFADFRQVECDEQVYAETSLGNPGASWGGMGRNATRFNFRYIIIPKRLGPAVAFDEYRTDLHNQPVDMRKLPGLRMITSAFASDWLYFSPLDQTQSRFRYLGTQEIRKQECYVVGFAQNPEVARSVSGFRIGDRQAVLLVQGVGWIDPQTFHILRVVTWLLAPRPDLGLLDEHTTADYSAVQPAGLAHSIWVPRDVVVTTLLRGAFFRNTHRYSNYKLFRVESTIKPAP